MKSARTSARKFVVPRRRAAPAHATHFTRRSIAPDDEHMPAGVARPPDPDPLGVDLGLAGPA